MISSSVNRIIYNGNGSTTAFTYTFKILASTDIKLMRVAANGTKTNITSDYYVDTAASKVYYPGYAPGATEPETDQPQKLQTGEKLVIYREVPINQLDSMPSQWPFDVNESMHDKSCIIDQQLLDGINRSLKFDVDLANTFNPTLPIKAGYGWRVSDDGLSIVSLNNPEQVYENTVSVYNSAVADCEAIRVATDAIKTATQSISDTTAGYRDSAATHESNAESYADDSEDYSELAAAWAQSSSSPDGEAGSKSSKSWAAVAQGNAADCAAYANQCQALASQAVVYDSGTTYSPADVVMTSDGATYRCVATSTGENPTTSNKWVLITTIITDTFEADENGDLMPLVAPKTSSQFEIDDSGDIMPIA